VKRKYIKLLLKFRYAFRGIVIAFKTQKSFRIHIITAIVIYSLSIVLNISLVEWVFTNAAVLFVLVAELFNTAIEHLCDFIHYQPNRVIKAIKDISAAAVLIAVLNSIITGSVIFVPKVVELIILLMYK